MITLKYILKKTIDKTLPIAILKASIVLAVILYFSVFIISPLTDSSLSRPIDRMSLICKRMFFLINSLIIVYLYLKNRRLLFEILASVMIGSVCFWIIDFISGKVVKSLIRQYMLRFTFYEGFADICFLSYTMIVCLMYFRIKRLNVIFTTIIAFIGGFVVAGVDHYVSFKSDDNGAYPWSLFLIRLQNSIMYAYRMESIVVNKLWWFLNLLLVGGAAKLTRKYIRRLVQARKNKNNCINTNES